ncbi:MAG: pyrrolo-quinoline quinone, partial [Steroidobacterales bacterium]
MSSVRRYVPAAALALLLTSCGGGGGGAGAGPTGGSGTSGGSNAGGGTAAVTDVLTYHNDNMRTGQNLTESALTPANVTTATFGKLRLLAADGRVDAQPLVVSGLIINGAAHNVVYVATEHDSVYAYDADTGALLARASMLGSGETPSDPRNCSQVSPEIGITATPVIDRSAGPNGTLFVVAMSMDASGNYYQRLHALDLTTLADRITPRVVQATAPGSGANSSGGILS